MLGVFMLSVLMLSLIIKIIIRIDMPSVFILSVMMPEQVLPEMQHSALQCWVSLLSSLSWVLLCWVSLYGVSWNHKCNTQNYDTWCWVFLCSVSLMLSLIIKLNILSFVMLSAFILSVVVPEQVWPQMQHSALHYMMLGLVKLRATNAECHN